MCYCKKYRLVDDRTRKCFFFVSVCWCMDIFQMVAQNKLRTREGWTRNLFQLYTATSQSSRWLFFGLTLHLHDIFWATIRYRYHGWVGERKLPCRGPLPIINHKTNIRKLLLTIKAGQQHYDGMVLTLDGNSERSANVRSNLCYLICLRLSIKPRRVTKWIFFLWKYPFSFMLARHVLSYHLI